MTEGIREVAIASPANPRVKAIVRLRDRREREHEGRTLVDGVREVRRALSAGAPLEAVYVGPAASSSPAGRAALEELAAAEVPLVPVSAAVQARLAFGDRAEGLVAVMRIPTCALGSLELPEDALVVVLEAVEKPGNLGAVLRSADGAGADALVVADPVTDLFNPNAIRASLGTIFGVPLAVATADETLAWCRDRGLAILAARVDAARIYSEVDLTRPTAIVLGSEASGLAATWDVPDVTPVRLPMLGIADSLNVSVAAAVLLYEARRQRDEAAGSSPRTVRRPETAEPPPGAGEPSP